VPLLHLGNPQFLHDDVFDQKNVYINKTIFGSNSLKNVKYRPTTPEKKSFQLNSKKIIFIR